jgi:adrenodoxin-NADP+ reductase
MAKKLLSHFPTDKISVHVFERLPFPFGLIRYGVAPDHTSIKNVAKEFGELDKFSNFRFFGNVDI